MQTDLNLEAKDAVKRVRLNWNQYIPPFLFIRSWNICCVGGGYEITDGGVVRWQDRIDRIIDSIINVKAHVYCLYETFDTASAFYIARALSSKGYNVYFNIGPKVIGVSSGILVASKFEISEVEFIQFPQETLVGRTKNAAKGVFGVTLQSQGKEFARIYATHLQHSEIPEYAANMRGTEEDKARRVKEEAGRKAQMTIIAGKVEEIRKKAPHLAVVVVGDLNGDPTDDNQGCFWDENLFVTKNGNNKVKTWVGDGFCAGLENKLASNSLDLDHALLARDSAQSIEYSVVDTGFDRNKFNPAALSDHCPLDIIVMLNFFYTLLMNKCLLNFR